MPALDSILDQAVHYPEKLKSVREVVLANAVMFGEIPAPTFGEERRARFLSDRFREESLLDVSTDEAGNTTAILPGKSGKRSILLAAHVDTVFPESVSHTVAMGQETMTGAGIADNSLGVGAVASLPNVLNALDLQLDDNLILVGVTKSLGRGDLGGLRFFLDHVKIPLRAAVCMEGVHLGRLSYRGLGMLRGEITCRVPEEHDWKRLGGTGAIIQMNRILSQILAIPTPQEPKTSIILGSVAAGTAYNTPPTTATLRFEVRSEETGMVGQVLKRIENIVAQIDYESDVRADLEIIARRRPGGIPFDHPLVTSSRHIMERLGVEPKIGPSTGELSALIAQNIPAVTLGLTRGEHVHEPNETVLIDPIFTGLAQVLGVLQAIDGGFCDDPH